MWVGAPVERLVWGWLAFIGLVLFVWVCQVLVRVVGLWCALGLIQVDGNIRFRLVMVGKRNLKRTFAKQPLKMQKTRHIACFTKKIPSLT